MPMKIYNRFFEIEGRLSSRREMYIFAGFGGGSETFIDDAFDQGNPAVRIPLRVADGEMTLEEYVTRGLGETERTPVFIFPYELSSEKEHRLDKTRRTNLASVQRQIPAVLQIMSASDSDVFVQSRAPIYRVKDTTEIDRLGIRNDDGGILIDVGNPPVPSCNGYLPGISDIVATRQIPNFRADAPVSRAASKLVEKILRLDRNKETDYFVVVVHADSVGKNGTLDSMNDSALAILVATLNGLSDVSNISFEAIVVVGNVKEGNPEVIEIAKKYEGSIKKVFERSVAIRDASAEVTGKERESWNVLETSFPNVKINKIGFTFVDSEETAKYGKVRVRSLPELSSPKKYLKMITDQDKKVAVTNAVNYLVNKNRDRVEKATTRSKTAIKKFATSLAMHDQTKDERAERAVASIVGRYPLDAGHDFVITDDPVALFSKATGQDWEEESCEKDGGMHSIGVYSDIEIGNCIAFIVEKETEHPVARIMLRWCEDARNKAKVGFGIERRWYYTTKPGKGSKIEATSKDLIYPRMSALRATALLAQILKDKGVYDYDYCDTPYRYAGYSDIMQGSNRNISYENLYIKYGKMFSLFVKGFKIDFSKIDMDELELFLAVDPSILETMSDDEFLFLVTAVVASPSRKKADNLSTTMFSNLTKNIQRTKLLANALIETKEPKYFYLTAFAWLNNQMEDRFKGYAIARDSDGLTSILVDPVYTKMPVIISAALGKMAMLENGKTAFKKIPPSAILGNNSPLVLMSGLAFFESIGDDVSFERCADKLASMFDLEESKRLLEKQDRRLRDVGAGECAGERYDFVARPRTEQGDDLAFCRHVATDNFFITYDLMKHTHKIGISIVVQSDPAYPDVPTGYRYPFEDASLAESFKKEYKNPVFFNAAFHLYKYYKEKGAEDKLARYPPDTKY